MDLVMEKIGDTAVIAIPVEELDAANSGDFKRDVAPLLDQATRIVFDLGKVRFVDSSGLGAFLSCLRKVNAKSGDVKLCRMSKQVRTVFELVRMHRIFDIRDTREAAVAAFANGEAKGIREPNGA